MSLHRANAIFLDGGEIAPAMALKLKCAPRHKIYRCDSDLIWPPLVAGCEMKISKCVWKKHFRKIWSHLVRTHRWQDCANQCVNPNCDSSALRRPRPHNKHLSIFLNNIKSGPHLQNFSIQTTITCKFPSQRARTPTSNINCHILSLGGFDYHLGNLNLFVYHWQYNGKLHVPKAPETRVPRTILIIMFCGLAAWIIMWKNWVRWSNANVREIAYPKKPGTRGSPNHVNYYVLGFGGLDYHLGELDLFYHHWKYKGNYIS